DKAEARVAWSEDAHRVARQINGLSPFPGAWCETPSGRLKLLKAVVSEGEAPEGTVLGDLRIACGTGAVEILCAQREGKRPMRAEDLLRGLDLPAGTVLT
ncbi:MAG: methionyl-tRNA formyltransferase, partial [Pararhodobacter sp.]|nr:methionyl-tRNA formyltransferase [Pararhodobacter sp.]